MVLQARLEHPLPKMCYTADAYLAYVFYPPLYIAGPMLSFKSFASQLSSPRRTVRSQVEPLFKETLCELSLISNDNYLAPGCLTVLPNQTWTLQMLIYGGSVLATGALLDLCSRWVYLHAVARTGTWQEMQQLMGFALLAPELLAMGFWTILFIFLKVSTYCRRKPTTIIQAYLLPCSACLNMRYAGAVRCHLAFFSILGTPGWYWSP